VGTTYEVYRLVNSLWNSSGLTRAALRGFADVVHGLLQWPGVNINYQESNGNTALHNAALVGHREIVEMLLLAGVNLTVLNHDGKVAANLAKTAYLRELIRNPALMSNRLKYQERVMDHLFLQLKCKDGMSLTLQEAVAANQMVEYTPQEPAPSRKSQMAQQSPLAVPAQSPGHCDGEISPPKQRSKYYKSPTRKAEDHRTVQNTGVGALKSILKHSSDGDALSAAPVVVFTPKSVPPELRHLFPHNAMAVPAHVQHALLLEDDLAEGPEHPPAPTAYNNNTIRTSFAPAALPATTDPVIDNIVRKYGPVPTHFGGCVSDFFHLRSLEPRRRKAQKDVMFLDLLTLQRSYVPSAFDSTDEWNEIKDFLWLLGHPIKSSTEGERERKSSAGTLPTALNTAHIENSEDQVQLEGEEHADQASVCSELTDPQHPHHSQPHLLPEYLQQHHSHTDRRYFLYQIAVTMNHIQACFTDTDALEVQTNAPKRPAGEYTASPAGPKNNTPIAGIAGQLPRIAPTQRYQQEHKTPSFMSSPVAQIKRALSLEEQSLRDDATLAESKRQQFEQDLDWTRIPKNLSRSDVHRLVRFTRHCEAYVLWVLQLYAPREQGWPNEMTDLDGHILIECVRYNVLYLQYYGLATPPIEEHLLNLVDLSYTAVFVDPPSAEVEASHHKVGFAEPSRQGAASEGLQTVRDTGRGAQSRRRAPDLLHNPPRYLRLAVDAVYEVSDFIKSRTEQGYPTDSVRAHLLAQAGRAMIAQQRAVAAKQLRGSVASGGSGGDGVINAPTSVFSPTKVALPGSDRPAGRANNNNNLAVGAAQSAVVTADSTVNLVSIVNPAQRAYRRWLAELLLLDYEAYFQHQGFRRLLDFVGLTEQDCLEYFPFLKVRTNCVRLLCGFYTSDDRQCKMSFKAGDLRRLARAAPLLTDESIAEYAAND
jgi:hypothetical protein